MPEPEEITEAQVVEPGAEVARVEPARLAVAPQVATSELGERLTAIKKVMAEEMVEGVDYGVIPGTGSKPTLLKPGAEKLGVLFQLDVQPENVQTWGPGDHLTVISKAVAYYAPTGTRVGRGEGICTTRERKYAYRQQSRQCPHCKAEAIIKGKQEYGGGWVCFKKKGGCGAKFNDGDSVIEGQAVGEVDNPDLPDLWNTVDKMAEKRARVDVILAVTGASAIFTQDVEDSAVAEAEARPAAGPPFGEAASPEVATSARKAIAWMLDEPVNGLGVTKVMAEIENRAGGYLPMIAARAVGHAAAAARAKAEPAAPAGSPDEETPEERKEREDAEAIVERAENEMGGVQV
jgi:hypothetical protein